MFGNVENTLWVEIFIPDTLDWYVGNELIISKVKLYLENGDVPHLLFYGGAGTGKTTLAKIIAKNVDADLMYINAYDENNVETVRTKNKLMPKMCTFCEYKAHCWSKASYQPKITSRAKSPPNIWYTTYAQKSIWWQYYIQNHTP